MGVVESIADKIVNNHHIMIENRLCSRFRTPRSDCTMCAELCPDDAIRFSDKGVEITERCIDCGVCFSACPNGAFRIEGRDDSKIISEIKNRIEGARDKGQWLGVFRISCERGDVSADIILPCLSRLTEVLLLEPIQLGASRIEIFQPSCQGCTNVKASSHLDRIIHRTLYLYEMIGVGKESILVRSSEFRDQKDSKLKTQNSEPKALSRRELLKAIRLKTMEVAVASIPDIAHKKEEKEEVFREVLHHRPENLKRSLLLKSIRDIGSSGKPAPLRGARPGSEAGGQGIMSQGSETQIINKVEVPSKDAILAEIEVTAECTACGVCATLCPTGAVIQRLTEDQFYLGFRPDLCTNCQVCIKTCIHKAINIKEQVSLNLLLEQREVKLLEAEKKTCPVCQMDFIHTPKSPRLLRDHAGGDSKNICPLCIDRHKKQMSAIQELFKNLE
ncbi:MAG: 4Fe-4S binding protein [Nitrospirota bacterium]